MSIGPKNDEVAGGWRRMRTD